jgi:hypothetical protein
MDCPASDESSPQASALALNATIQTRSHFMFERCFFISSLLRPHHAGHNAFVLNTAWDSVVRPAIEDVAAAHSFIMRSAGTLNVDHQARFALGQLARAGQARRQ